MGPLHPTSFQLPMDRQGFDLPKTTPRPLAPRGAGMALNASGRDDQTALGDAARQFEAILVRQMLSSLEKTTRMDANKPASNVFGSMVVDAMSDALVSGGGMGLAKYVEETLAQQLPQGPTAQGSAAQGPATNPTRPRDEGSVPARAVPPAKTDAIKRP